EFGSAAFWEALLTDAAVAGGMDGAWPMVVEGTAVESAAATWLDRVTLGRVGGDGGGPVRTPGA
ncbi:hypothetical protein G6025_16040, partial [Dietzia natronolimnaea]|nr:hypothetical protein [Dietzia natronolimnaea]